MKKKKRKETPHQGKGSGSASGENVSAGFKRKWEQVVEPSVDEVRMQAGDNPAENKQKRRKKSHLDAITSVQ